MDIYFTREYAQLYAPNEGGEAKSIHVKTTDGEIIYHFIQRPIHQKIDGKQYYDMITPNGYGGPLIVACHGKIQRLLQDFRAALESWVRENDIVSEFIRFHPVIRNDRDFSSIYALRPARKTVGTDLTLQDPFQEEFSRSCRKNIRRALRDGLDYRVTKNPKDVLFFEKFYNDTMDRNEASDFYYFGHTYFENILSYFPENLILVETLYNGEPIAMGLYFHFEKTIHIHLSGTLSEHLHRSPAYVLRYAITKWGKENGYELIHHGGGRTNREDDGLYLFKKQFGQSLSFEFHPGTKIWNSQIYLELCRQRGIDSDAETFFPAYRKGEDQ